MSEARSSEAIHVPADLQRVLRDFTKAVLRDMPADVLAYSKDYFVERAAEQRMDAYSLPPSNSKPCAELNGEMQMQVENVFKRYDEDMDGKVQHREFTKFMKDLASEITDQQVATLITHLDRNGNDAID